MTVPLVTAVVPVYNGERFVAEAVRSVLGQTWTAVEVLVVDDGSTDATAEVVGQIDDERVRYVRQENAGVSPARNEGIRLARGELVAFLDADDVWLPDKLARQVEIIASDPSVGLVVTGYLIVDELLTPLRPVIPRRGRVDLERPLLLEGAGIGLSFTGMVRRDIAAAVGFNASYSTSADLEFALRVGRTGGVVAVPDVLSLYRTHIDQMHLDVAAFERDVLRIHDEWVATSPWWRRRRARANLYTRMFVYEIVRRRWTRAARSLGRALVARPDRVVLLPVSMAWGRGKNLWTGRRALDQATPRAES